MAGLQPHGADFRYALLALRWYEAARPLGLDLDNIGAGASLSGYRAELEPTLPIDDGKSWSPINQGLEAGIAPPPFLFR